MSRTTNSRTVMSRAASEPLPRNVKLAIRNIERQSNKESVLVKGPNDPPVIRPDILVSKVVETFIATGSSLSLTYNGVYKLLDPGMTPFFNTMRVVKISVYGIPSTTTNEIVQLAVTYDGAQFLDRGVGTARLGVLHVRLPEFVRETWVETTNTNTLGLVTAPVGTAIQVTLQVRANAFGDT